MAEYENEFSHFPSKYITRHHFKNIDDDIAPTIHAINALRAQGLYSQADALIHDNVDKLSPYIVDAVTFRTLEEEIYNTQIYALQSQQSIHFGEEEPDCAEDNVWIGGD